jgi:hypothetical protein
MFNIVATNIVLMGVITVAIVAFLARAIHMDHHTAALNSY